MVDWEAIRTSQKLLSSYSIIWIAKYATGFLPIGVNMQLRKEWGQNHCSRCGIEVETKRHIGRCKEATSTCLFQENLEIFEKWMHTMQTPTLLQVHILMRITAWRMDTPCTVPIGMQPPPPITSQLDIGAWENFMEGRLHHAWREYMDTHYASTKSRRTGKQWVSQCIQRLWRLFHLAQWHHRNKFVHNTTNATTLTRKTEELRYFTAQAYHSEDRTNLLVKDQHLYDIRLSDLLQFPDDAMISWLKEHELARRDRDEFYNSNVQESSNLRTWLVPKRSSSTTQDLSSRKRLKSAKNSQEWSKNGTIDELRRGSWQPP